MSKLDKLNKLYAKIPDIECQGLCHQSCTIVPAATIEIKRARERMKGKNPFTPIGWLIEMRDNPTNKKIPSCGALKEKKCSIYTVRPGICRLYGVAEGLECPFGCLPKSTLTKQEAINIIREIEAL